MLDGLTSALTALAQRVVLLLPASPVQSALEAAPAAVTAALGYLNWFVPVGAICSTLLVWLSAIAVYHIYQIVLRWVKVVE